MGCWGMLPALVADGDSTFIIFFSLSKISNNVGGKFSLEVHRDCHYSAGPRNNPGKSQGLGSTDPEYQADSQWV